MVAGSHNPGRSKATTGQRSWLIFTGVPTAPACLVVFGHEYDEPFQPGYRPHAMIDVINFYNRKPPVITVNGERISGEAIDASVDQFVDARKPREAAARALVLRTLLRQRAAALHIEADDEEAALEKLLEQEVSVPPVTDEEVRRYFDANRQKYRSGDLFEVSHILFENTGNADDRSAVQEAETVLMHLRDAPESFAQIAREKSACTTAPLGGSLGQLSRGSVAPEFWSALVKFGKAGLLPHLVETRFGLHIVLIHRCAMGEAMPFEAVESRVRAYLTDRRKQLSYQQYIADLIEQAEITGIDLGDQSPQPAGPGLPLE